VGQIIYLVGLTMYRLKIGIYCFFCFFCFIGTHLFGHPYPPHPKNIEQVTPCNIAIGCVFKNEASWLKEWIEYHLLVGVEHFYLYNNCSDDDYLKVLLPYIEDGIVELFDFYKPDFSNFDQGELYNNTLKYSRDKTKWLAIIDTDEFINPFNENNLNDYLNKYETAASIYIRWQQFGTSGVKNLKPKELLIEKLVFRAPDGDAVSEAWGKTIYQTQRTLSIDNPHWGSHSSEEYIHRPSTNEIKVNHYFVRTEDFLYGVKLERLKVWKGGHQFNSEALFNYLPIANSTLDSSMDRYIVPLREAMNTRLD
jgi:hypothetical protein